MAKDRSTILLSAALVKVSSRLGWPDRASAWAELQDACSSPGGPTSTGFLNYSTMRDAISPDDWRQLECPDDYLLARNDARFVDRRPMPTGPLVIPRGGSSPAMERSLGIGRAGVGQIEIDRAGLVAWLHREHPLPTAETASSALDPARPTAPARRKTYLDQHWAVLAAHAWYFDAELGQGEDLLNKVEKVLTERHKKDNPPYEFPRDQWRKHLRSIHTEHDLVRKSKRSNAT